MSASVRNQPSADDSRHDIVIIGAGIVGLSLAVRLQLEGRQVVLVDPEEPASGASFGNAGYLTRGSIFPPASPDMIKRLPLLLLDPSGPLIIRPSYAPRLASWGYRLISASRPRRSGAIIEALASLCREAVTSYQPLLAAAKAEDLIDIRGSLVVCRLEETLEQKSATIPTLRAHGISVEKVDAAEAVRLEPGLSPKIKGALYFPDNARCTSPGLLGKRFAASVREKGGQFVTAAVRSLAYDGEFWSLNATAGVLRARHVIVAAGRWSDELLSPLGYRIPLASERGYHLMLPRPGVSLTRPCVMAEPFFAATPMVDGLRLAGTVEFAATDRPMDPARSDMLFKLAQPYLPGLVQDGATRWMGVRPSFPDALPAIGRATRHNNLFYCFGHQHIGLTTAAISAQLLVEVMLGRTPSADPEPFNLDRFNRQRRKPTSASAVRAQA